MSSPSEHSSELTLTRHQELQRIMRRYKEETGEKEVDMHKVAKYAASLGWPLPKPTSPIDLLAKALSQAAREEIRRDPHTGRPYRANHAYPKWNQGELFTVWVDIDEAPRAPMQKSLVNRREQMVGDGLQLTLDADHWNSIHPEEAPIVLPMDFTTDIEWRKNAPNDEEEAA